MKVLLVYATYSSGTFTASGYVEDLLKELGHQVTRQKAIDTQPEDFKKGYDLIILATPSWEVDKKDGQPHIHMGELMRKLGGQTFEGQKFAIFGLGDIHYARFCGAVKHLEQFVEDIKGTHVGKSLRINRYVFDEEYNNKLLEEWVKETVAAS